MANIDDDFLNFDPFGRRSKANKQAKPSSSNEPTPEVDEDSFKFFTQDSKENNQAETRNFDLDEVNSFVFYDDDSDSSNIRVTDEIDEGDSDVKIYHAGDAKKNKWNNQTSKNVRDWNPGKAQSEVTKKDTDNQDFDNDYFETVYTDKGKGFKIAVIIILIIATLAVASFAAFRYVRGTILGEGEIYDGVLVNGFNLGGMTKKEAADYIEKTYFTPIKGANVVVKLGITEKSYPLTSFVICQDANELAEEAYKVARTGSESERVKKINALKETPYKIVIEYEITHEPLSEIIELATEQGFEAVINPTYDIRDAGVVFTAGRNGAEIDVYQFKMDLSEALSEFEESIKNVETNPHIDNITIQVQTVSTEFKKLNADEIMKAAYQDPVNAEYYRDGTGKNAEIKIKEDVSGRTLDATELTTIVTRINNGDELPYYELGYVEVKAEMTAESIRDNLFGWMLSSVSSTITEDLFSVDAVQGQTEREKNILRCCELLGTISLLPNEELSFLDVISSLSQANGFVIAYENICGPGKKVMGGGVSQFASALYEAALRAGLTVVRVNHNSYYPNYGRLGFDAYISTTGGTYDLIIKNEMKMPVRISSVNNGDSFTIEITGTESDKGAVTISSIEKSKTVATETVGGVEKTIGMWYKFSISITQGDTTTALGTVTYQNYGEGVEPSVEPDQSAEPTENPTSSGEPMATPSENPTATPSGEPSASPMESPTPTASGEPSSTENPTATPTGEPSAEPTENPQAMPSGE